MKGRFLRLLLSSLIIVLVGGLGPSSAYTAFALLPPNNCVGIASDSNGFGHVTFQLLPVPDGRVGIIYVQPLNVIMRAQLDSLGLDDLAVTNRSLTAGGLTASDRTNYLKSSEFGSLLADRCKFIIVGPFIPDVAAAKGTPQDYISNMIPLVAGLIANNPRTTIFVLSHYQTQRADFTADNNGFGMTEERINAFNQKLMDTCAPNKALGRIPQVICVNTQALFAGMGASYLLAETTRAQFKALVYASTGFKPVVEQYFLEHPESYIIGDGIHLSLAGRIRLMQRMAQMISRLNSF